MPNHHPSPQQAPELATRLRAATADLHKSLDHHALLRRLLARNLTLAEYRQILSAMYGFVAILEGYLDAYESSWQHYGLRWQERRKLSAITADLADLGCLTSDLRPCPDLPPPQSLAEAWGYLYVVEGSTLGGQYIAKALSASLGVNKHFAGRYYHGYGSQTAARWQGFKEGLQHWEADVLGSDQDFAACAEAASTTAATAFLALTRWLSH